MSAQNWIGAITLVGLAVVSLGFVYVISQAGRTADPARLSQASQTVRQWWFWALIVLGIGVAWGTLKPFPIPPQWSPLQAAQTVDVVGQQWAWSLSTAHLAAGTPVEFRVTSSDVNHSFAIYDPQGHIVIQTQAMPGYTNKLLYTFREPGTYMVRCLEYCGVAHHVMQTRFEVTAAATGGRP